MSGLRPCRVAFVLIDGIGDVAYESLGQKTPLQAASTPNMDRVASFGLTGLMDPVRPGLACGSDTAHLCILGYYRGRGSFESMGAGLDMVPGDVAFKCNFSTMDNNTGVVVARRADREFEREGAELCRLMDGTSIPGFPEYEVAIKYATEHRCGLRLRGPRLSDKISGTDPLKDGLPLGRCRATVTGDEDAAHTAKVVNALSDHLRSLLEKQEINVTRKRLGKNPANVMLLRGAGAPSFLQHHGMTAFMIAPTWMSLGIDVVRARGATGDYHTDMVAKARALVQHFKDHEDANFGFLHLKAVDDSGHDGALSLRVKLLERADAMVKEVVDGLRELEGQGSAPFVVVVTGDHSTPCSFREHSYEPVPFCVSKLPAAEGIPQPSLWADSVRAFDEVSVGAGALGRFTGDQVMRLVRWYCGSGV